MSSKLDEAFKNSITMTKAEKGAPMLTNNPLWFSVNGEPFYITMDKQQIKSLFLEIVGDEIDLEPLKPLPKNQQTAFGRNLEKRRITEAIKEL